MLRRIFELEIDELIRGLRKLRNDELHNLYSSPSITRMIKVKKDEIGRACSTYGGETGCP
jgi:hypothetical protein